MTTGKPVTREEIEEATQALANVTNRNKELETEVETVNIQIVEIRDELEAAKAKIEELEVAKADLEKTATRVHGLEQGNADARRMVDAILWLLEQRTLSHRQEARINKLEADLKSTKDKLEQLAREEQAVEQALDAIGQKNGGEGEQTDQPTKDPDDKPV